MAIKTTGALAESFKAGATPTGADFANLIDSIGDVPTVADMLADTATYGAQSRAVGEIIRAGGFRYKVAASGATDHHLATAAGGVKLYVQTDETGGRCVDAFGCVGDGVASDAAAMALALAVGGALRLTTGKIYFGNHTEHTVLKAFTIEGNGAEIRDFTFAGNVGGIGRTVFNNINFTTNRTADDGITLPTQAAKMNNSDYVVFKNCNFLNTSLYSRCDNGGIHKGVSVVGCLFDVDWAGFTDYQKDVVTISGHREVREYPKHCVWGSSAHAVETDHLLNRSG